MGRPLFMDVDLEGLFSEGDRVQSNRERASRVTVDTADRLQELRRVYPWLPGGAAMSLAQAGVGPDDAVAQLAAEGARRKKSKSGIGWHTVGSVVGGVGKVAKGAADVVSDAADFVTPEAVEDQIGETNEMMKANIRGTMVALETPYQELQSFIRGAGWGGVRYKDQYGRINPFDPKYWQSMWDGVTKGGRSTGVKALQRLARGDRVDLGTGFFSGGEVREEYERDTSRLQVNGHGVTVGRVVADKVVEPGTTPYKVMSGLLDASVLLAADPANVAFAKFAQARKARHLFAAPDKPLPTFVGRGIRKVTDEMRLAAGLVDGRRKTVLPEMVDEWLEAPATQPILEWLEATDRAVDVLNGSKSKMPAEIARRFADARSVEEVKAIIRETAVGQLREKPSLLSPLAEDIKRWKGSIRLLGTLPGDSIPLDDLDEAVAQIQRFGLNAKLPREFIDNQVERFIRANGSPEQYKVVTETIMGRVRDDLVAAGADKRHATRLTKLFEDSHDELRHYWINEIGEDQRVPGVVLNGKGNPVVSPHLWSQLLNRSIPLPDRNAIREIRRQTSFLAPIYKTKYVGAGMVGATELLNYAQDAIWKPLTLLRGAWTARVVGEEQFRIGMSGQHSLFSTHPLSFVAMLAADDNKIGRALRAAGVKGKAGTGVTGESILAEGGDALMRATRDFEIPGMIRTKHFPVIDRADPQAAQAWAWELGMMADDPLIKEALRRTPEDARKWFRTSPFRKALAQANPAFNKNKVADAYMDSMYARIKQRTGGDDDLLDLLRSGELEPGKPLTSISDGGAAGPSKEFVAYLDAVIANDEIPEIQKFIGPLWVNARGKAPTWYDEAMNSLFAGLMAKPSNWLSRSKSFRQFYWDRAEELVPLVNADDQAKLLDNARAANLGKDKIAAMQAAAKMGAGELTLEQADLIAKAYGVGEAKRLLYSLTEKGQFSDVFRVAFPFGEAWKEILTTWARLGMETGGKPLRSVQRVVEGARGAGFFYTDPATGEEVFAYPGSQFVSEAVVGAPIPMTSPVGGLNMFSTNPAVPGFGPLVQIPMSKLLPNKPDYDWVRDLVMPFGDPGGVTEAVAPAWAEKLITGLLANPDSDRQLGSSVMDMAAWLKSTGGYGDSPEEMLRLEKDAVAMGRRLFVLRGLEQFGAPSAPAPEEVAMDRNGKLITAFALRDQYRQLLDKHSDDPYQATVEFLNLHGPDSLLFMQPKTRGGFDPTDKLHDWVRDNPDLVKLLPSTYGFFAPDGGDFSFSEYERQLAAGEKETLRPGEAIKLANHRVASMIYGQARDRVGPRRNQAARQFLQQVRDELLERFPGYDPYPRDLGRTDRVIRELQQAVTREELADTPTGRGLTSYFKAREVAVEEARRRGLATFARANKARPIRAWLREQAADISAKNPAFLRVWDEVLSRELVDDEE